MDTIFDTKSIFFIVINDEMRDFRHTLAVSGVKKRPFGKKIFKNPCKLQICVI